MTTQSRLLALAACVALTIFIGIDEKPICLIAEEHISDSDRDVAVETLKHADISKTAPEILRLLHDYAPPSEPGSVEKPWMSPHLSYRAKVWYASLAVWHALFAGNNDPSKARILLKLLSDNHDEYSHYLVLNELRFHWNSEVEKKLLLWPDARAVWTTRKN